ncbi:MAG: hypothetical protein M3018_08865, partial [Actinomycetota bacterium]|nr:hypothetical protein [Actinomycetota bacterium]
LRARVALLQGHRSRATQILQNLLRSEPLNIRGWVLLAQAAATDRPIFDQAILNISRLDRIGSRAG